MPECSPFEHFARDLFLRSTHFETEISDDEENLDAAAGPILTDASIVLGIFADAYCELFLESFAQTGQHRVLQTDQQFFHFAIPRCLKLVDRNRYHFSLMLVASFLHELVHILRRARVCYRFHFTAYKCLAAVFERSFKDSFATNGGWKGFGNYLNDVIEAYSATNEKLIMTVLNDGDTFRCEEVKELIKRCDDIPDGFKLNEYEFSLLMDDDIEDMEESLQYDEGDEDPLNMSWPIEDEVFDDKSQSANYYYVSAGSYPPSTSDPNTGKDMKDNDKDQGYEDKDSYYSILDYAGDLESEAEVLLGTEKFLEKIKLRSCPYCGIKCYQFSKKLSRKQIDLALTNKVLGNSFENKPRIYAKL